MSWNSFVHMSGHITPSTWKILIGLSVLLSVLTNQSSVSVLPVDSVYIEASSTMRIHIGALEHWTSTQDDIQRGIRNDYEYRQRRQVPKVPTVPSVPSTPSVPTIPTVPPEPSSTDSAVKYRQYRQYRQRRRNRQSTDSAVGTANQNRQRSTSPARTKKGLNLKRDRSWTG